MELAAIRDRLGSRFSVVREIGRGAFGIVVEARAEGLGKVAVKLLAPQYLEDAAVRARFLREAEASKAIAHEGIVRVLEIEPEGAFFVMELAGDESLADRIRASKRIAAPEVRRIGARVLEALAVAHERGVVHRDVKPSNLLLAGDKVKLADFGVARVAGGTGTEAGEFLGTPAYTAPEQLRGHAVDRRADLYALGATLFEAATGEQLHGEGRFIADPTRLLLEKTGDPQLAGVIAKAIAEIPENRFSSAEEMKAAIVAKKAPSERARHVALAAFAVATIALFFARSSKEPAEYGIAHSVALLPFDDATGLEELEYARAGLPYLLGTELAREVPVIGYYRLRSLAGSGDFEAAAKGAGAQYLLHGRISGTGVTRVHLALELTAGGKVRWSTEDDLEPKDIPLAVRRAAPAIAGEILGRPVTPAGDEPRSEYLRHYLAGVTALRAHQLHVARRELSEAEAINPNSAELHYHLAILDWWLNSHSSVILMHVHRALELGTEGPERGFLEGLELLETHRDAVSTFKRLTAQYPEHEDLRYGLFEALFHAGRGEEAIQTYRALGDADPKFRLGLFHVLTYAVVHSDEALFAWAFARAGDDPLEASWPAKMAIARREYARGLEDVEAKLEQTRGIAEKEIDADLFRTALALYTLTGHPELAIAALQNRTRIDDLLARYALTMESDALLTALRANASAGDPVEPWCRLTLLDPRPSERLAELRKIADPSDDRVELLEAIVAALEGRVLTADTDASGSPELIAAREAASTSDPRSAARGWTEAAELSTDGRFQIVERYLAAKNYDAAGDRDAARASCDLVLHPKLFRWDWVVFSKKCEKL